MIKKLKEYYHYYTMNTECLTTILISLSSASIFVLFIGLGILYSGYRSIGQDNQKKIEMTSV